MKKSQLSRLWCRQLRLYFVVRMGHYTHSSEMVCLQLIVVSRQVGSLCAREVEWCEGEGKEVVKRKTPG